MTDPYKVLGVEPTATDEQIKSAYRELAKKYHPDANAQSSLSELAEEKMKEINEAYDAIMNMRRSGGNASQFTDIRNLINNGRTIEAEELLDGVPENYRDAEWYFLKGSIMYLKGWLDQAYTYFSTACRMNPQTKNTPPH